MSMCSFCPSSQYSRALRSMQLFGKYNPKTVIPAHYFLNGLTTDISGLDSADGWVNDQEKGHHADVRRLDNADLTLNVAALKGSHHRVCYFGSHFEEKWRFDEQSRVRSRHQFLGDGSPKLFLPADLFARSPVTRARSPVVAS